MKQSKFRHTRHILAFLLTLALMCGLFSGCGDPDAASMSDWKPGSDPSALQVWCAADSTAVTQAAAWYRGKYPDKKLELTGIGSETDETDSIVQQMVERIKVGKGPDVLVIGLSFFNRQDIYKLCESGVFEDLDPYFDADSDWSWENYNMAVIDGIEMDGHQYLMPLTYELPIMIGELSALSDMDFNYRSCKNGLDLFEEMKNYVVLAAGEPEKCALFEENTYFSESVLDYLQCNPLNYETGKVEWTENFAQVMDTYRQYYQAVGEDSGNRRHTEQVEYYEQQLDFRDFLLLGQNCITAFTGKFYNMQAIDSFGTPVMIPICNTDGSGISAQLITAAGICTSGRSSRKQDAYTFLKILLSDEVQRQSYTFASTTYSACGYCPVNCDSMRAIWEINGQTYAHGAQYSSNGYSGAELDFPALPDRIFEQYIELTEQVNHVFMNIGPIDIIGCFRKYLDGEQSYEAALQKAERELTDYLAEPGG